MKPEKNNYIKGSKKMRVRKNINWRDKNFQLEGLIELKNSFKKRKKKSKDWGSNWKKIKQQKIWLKDKIERKKNFNKNVKDKIRNLKNKNRTEKPNIWEIAIKWLNWKE